MLRDSGPDLHALSVVKGLIVALDCPSRVEAEALADRVVTAADAFKIGLELFVGEGPSCVRAIGERTQRRIFLDLKLHDIPETVDRAVARACALGVSLLTVHTSGGAAMLERAVSRAAKEATGLTIVGVTVLTSLDTGDLQMMGVARDAASQALVLAQMGTQAGVTAFVCSPREVGALRDALGPEPLLITPGVRPLGADDGDQKRTDTPESAIARGASAVVVGRPIRDARDPREAAERIASALRLARP